MDIGGLGRLRCSGDEHGPNVNPRGSSRTLEISGLSNFFLGEYGRNAHGWTDSWKLVRGDRRRSQSLDRIDQYVFSVGFLPLAAIPGPKKDLLTYRVNARTSTSESE